jgi:hypothetical protein
MLVSEITIYDALKGMLGEEKARQAVAGIKEEVAREVEIQKKGLATKEDIYALKEDIYALRVDISEVKADMLKWIIVLLSPFYLGLLAFLIKYFFKV